MGRSRLTYLAEKKGTRIRSIMGLTDPLAPLNPVELADALGIEVMDPSDISGLSKSALVKLLFSESSSWSEIGRAHV